MLALSLKPIPRVAPDCFAARRTTIQSWSSSVGPTLISSVEPPSTARKLGGSLKST